MIFELLGQALPQYEVLSITDNNYADVREIFETNCQFLKEAYGNLIDEKGVLGAILQLPDESFSPVNKYIAAICKNGRTVAAVDLLANFPAEGEIYLSFLIVHEDMKGRGFGSIITEGIVRAAGFAGFTRIILNSFKSTAEFWRKQGFEQTSCNDDFLAFHRSIYERAN